MKFCLSIDFVDLQYISWLTMVALIKNITFMKKNNSFFMPVILTIGYVTMSENDRDKPSKNSRMVKSNSDGFMILIFGDTILTIP